MKLPQIQKIKVSILLQMLLLLALVVQGYLVYKYLYPNLNVSDDILTIKDIVRVDLKSYQDTINLLNDLENYVPVSDDLIRLNPFR
ncbi:MAG TPA: hypothetical protein VD998_02895 [Verrucomicrobiae bacterium]|nr:hypothetical protein [Verrucomicrobiae bacterium]